MKKPTRVLTLAILMTLLAGVSWSAEPGTAEYKKMADYKKAQREKKAAAKTQGVPEEKNFWQKEAERSGFTGTAAMFGNAIGGVIPVDKPNSRKNN